jgi:hypothetical protein
MPSRNAGFFLWIDLSACLHSPLWEVEDDLRQRLYDYGVEMSSGRAYRDEIPGKFRFLFSVNRDTLMEGLRRCVLLLFLKFTYIRTMLNWLGLSPSTRITD